MNERTKLNDQGWNWTVEHVADPDRILSTTRLLVATADSMILDHCVNWTNLATSIITRPITDAWSVDLSKGLAACRY